MDKLRIFLNSKIGWIMEVLITVTILFTSLFLPTAFVDIAVSVTIILMVDESKHILLCCECNCNAANYSGSFIFSNI